MNIEFDKIKTLKAIECKYGTWMLLGSYYYEMNNISSGSFELIEEFNTLEECKIFSDLNLSNVKLHVVSYKDWLSNWFS